MKMFAAFSILIAALAALSGGPAAQTAPAGPTASQTENASSDAQPDFSGSWSLDRSLSTDPGQMTLLPSANGGQSPTGSRGRGGIGLGGFGRQRGGGQGARSAGDVLTPDEQAKLKVLTNQLKTASATLVITHKEPSFIVSDAQGNALFFETDGASDDNQLAGETLTSSTRWDTSRLVTEYVLGSHLTVVYTYTLLPKTNQLVLRVTRKTDGTQRMPVPEIKLAYKLTPAQR
jgi:hypothetical protein